MVNLCLSYPGEKDVVFEPGVGIVRATAAFDKSGSFFGWSATT